MFDFSSPMKVKIQFPLVYKLIKKSLTTMLYWSPANTLQQCVGWTASIHVQATSVCIECGGSARPSVTWPSECDNSDGRKTPLARISTSSHVQVVRPDLQRSAWIGTRLLVQTMCSSSQRSWPCTSQVGFSWTAHGANYEQKDDWRQRVLSLWPCGMEQSSSASAERRLHPIIRLFQKTLEDGPVQTDHPKIIIQ